MITASMSGYGQIALIFIWMMKTSIMGGGNYEIYDKSVTRNKSIVQFQIGRGRGFVQLTPIIVERTTTIIEF